MHTLVLKRGEDRRVRAGHPWVFSNEVKEFPSEVEPGAIVRIASAGGKTLGLAYANPRTLICARMLVPGPDRLEPDFIHRRMSDAAKLRTALYGEAETCRVVYGESDGLPGLVVDRYGPCVAVQILTAGMHRMQREVLDAVEAVLRPQTLILRNDSPYRRLEGLPLERRVIRGDWTGPVEVRFAGMRLYADVLDGQKTGLFLDQRENLEAVVAFSRGARVLDCFSYTGSWGIKAALSGASRVTAVDTSGRALELATANAKANGCDRRWQPLRGDAFQVLEELRSGPAFDVVVLDPPAFVRRKDRIAAAKRRYREINAKAVEVLRPGGVLISCSCSHHLDRASFRQILSEAVSRSGRRAVILEERGQAKDHPVLLAARETEYLKCFVLRVW